MSSAIEDVRKLFQDLIAPELRTISEQVKANAVHTELRLKALEEKMDLRFDAVMTELATAKRLERLEQRIFATPSQTTEDAH